jgi:hypothetical protein
MMQSGAQHDRQLEGAPVARSDPAGDGRRPRQTLVALSVVVLLSVVVGVLVARRGTLLPGRERTALTYGISVTPDQTGTLVELVGETPDGSLPSRLDLDLVVTDDAHLTRGVPSTGARLRYSDLKDGLGNTFPADQVRSGRLRGVGTDGRRLSLSFHAGSVGSRRVVYPVPRSEDITWVRARVYAQTETVMCWADGRRPDGRSAESPSERSAFTPCEHQAGEEIDGSRHSSIRLELRPSRP